MADAQSLGVTFLPADDEDASAVDALAAATTAALDDGLTEVPQDPPVPFGRSWAFDWEAGRFIRAGGAPAEVRDFFALEQWVQMAIHSARWAHPVFSDFFGMEDPDAELGELGSDLLVDEWGERLRDALLPHDRIVGVENFSGSWDPANQAILVDTFDVVTDEGESVRFGGFSVSTVEGIDG